MPYSYAVYTGNGSTTQYAITFPYIRKEHVKVYVNYVDTAYTYANNTTVQLATAPANGLRVEVRRVTPANSVLVDYTDGSTLVAADLDTSNLQHLYLEQELDDALKQSIAIDSATGLPTAGGQRIINVGNPVNAQDAATKNYVDLVALGAISGNVTIDSGTLFVDATNDRVGIGTTNPSAQLHLSSSVLNASSIRIDRGGAATNYLLLGLDAGESAITANGVAGINAALIFKRDSNTGTPTESARIDGSGRLLVGTNISSQYTATTSSIQLTSADSAQDPRIQLKANATTDVAAIDFGGGGQRHGTVQGESGGLVFYTNNSAGTSGVTSRMTIDSAGDITIAGVGTKIKADFTNATAASRAYFQSSTTNGLTSVGALPNGTSTTAGLLAHNNSTPTNSAYIGTVIDNVGTYLRSTRVGSGTSLPLYIQTGNTPTTRMTFDTAGDITIAGSARIKGDFSDSTAVYDRVCFKTSITNNSTFVTTLPSGTSEESGFCAVNKSYDSTTFGSSILKMGINSTEAYLYSTATGIANSLDLVLGTVSNPAIRIDGFQNVLIGVASQNPLGSNLQISSGITFPAAPVVSTDPNTLDKYEEGTWTPTIAGATTTGVGTYTFQVGRYTQIGNVITLHFNLIWTAHTGTGNMRLAGFPVTSANVANLFPIALCYANNLTITGVLSCNVLPNNTYASLNAVNNGTGTALAMDTAATIAGTITYQTA